MAHKKNLPTEQWRIPISFPIELRERIKEAAAADDDVRNINDWIVKAVTEILDQAEDTDLESSVSRSGAGGTGEYIAIRDSRDLSPEDRARFFPELSNDELLKEIEDAILLMQEDFRYPMNRNGDQMDMRFLGPWIAYHLTRCGWRNVEPRRMIKARPAREIPPGCYEDLVEWVSIAAPDDLDPSKLTLEQLKTASPSVQAAAIRAMNGQAGPIRTNAQDPMDQIWKQPIQVNVENDPELEQQMRKQGL